MATNQERMRVLRMVEEGKITSEEGVRLLAAMGADPARRGSRGARGAAPPRRSSERGPHSAGHSVRLRVTDTASGDARLNITLPRGVVDFLLRAGRHAAPVEWVELAGIDLEELSMALSGGARGRVVDYYDPDEGQRVEVIIE